jgi:hypothetical protein
LFVEMPEAGVDGALRALVEGACRVNTDLSFADTAFGTVTISTDVAAEQSTVVLTERHRATDRTGL